MGRPGGNNSPGRPSPAAAIVERRSRTSRGTGRCEASLPLAHRRDQGQDLLRWEHRLQDHQRRSGRLRAGALERAPEGRRRSPHGHAPHDAEDEDDDDYDPDDADDDEDDDVANHDDDDDDDDGNVDPTWGFPTNAP